MRGPGVVDGYRDNPEATRSQLPRRLVPHRRLRPALRRRLPVAGGPHQGADQPRRREDLAARGRGRAARSSRGRRGRGLRIARREVRRDRRRRRGDARRPSTATSCARTAASGWPPSRCRRASTSWMRSRRGRPARCSGACWLSSCSEGRRPRGRGDRLLRRRGARARRRRRLADRARCATRRAARARRDGPEPARRLPRAPAATDDPAEIGPVDIVFLGLKAYSYASTGPLLAPLLHAAGRGRGPERHAVVVLPPSRRAVRRSPHRGRRPGRRDTAAIAPERAIGCVVYCSTELEEPGVVRHGEGTRFVLGEPDGSRSERCPPSAALVAGGLKAPVESDLRTRSGSSCSATPSSTRSARSRAPRSGPWPAPGDAGAGARGDARVPRDRACRRRSAGDRDRAPHRRRRARRRAPHLDAAGPRGGQAARARRPAGRRCRAGRSHATPAPTLRALAAASTLLAESLGL